MTAKPEYRPMGAPPKYVSQERMQEILRRRSGGVTVTPEATPRSQPSAPVLADPARPQLKWRRYDKYAMVSECGKYSVSKDGATPAKYQSWYRTPEPAQRLGREVSTFAEAAAICEQHLKGSP